MKRANEILKNHFGDFYPQLQKWEYYNHILNAMNEYKNEGIGETLEAPEAWKEVLTHLINKSGIKYKFVASHRTIINARLKEKYSVADLKQVIDTKAKEWKDTKNEMYLRPITLFKTSKIDGYLNQAEKTGATGDDNFNFNPSTEAQLL